VELALANDTSVAPTRSRAITSNDLLMLGVTIIWGINFSVLKVALQYFSPLAFNALRFSLATLIMLLALRWQRESIAVSRSDLLAVVGLGLLGHTLYQLVFINGLARTTPANASLLMATAPIFVVLYGRILGIERTNRLVWGGICVSFAGILLLVLGGGGQVRLGGSTILGDLLVLGAAMLWAAYTTGSKPLLARPYDRRVGGIALFRRFCGGDRLCRLVHQRPARRQCAYGHLLESHPGRLSDRGMAVPWVQAGALAVGRRRGRPRRAPPNAPGAAGVSLEAGNWKLVDAQWGTGVRK
jgi:hypothetical protein